MDPANSLSEDLADLSLRDQTNNASLTRVSRERDCFVDEDHKALDEEIMETFSSVREQNGNPSWPALLFNITGGDERIVTLSIPKARKLLSTQPYIEQLLQEAWKSGSFKEVRRLSEFVAAQHLSKSLIIFEGILWPVVRETRRLTSPLFWN